MNIKNSIAISLLLCSTISYAAWQDLAGDMLKTITENKTVTNSTNTTLDNNTISSGLKEALKKGVNIAVTQLGKENGYFSNELVKIPLPNNLDKVKAIVEKAGGQKYINELELAINNAATQAVPKTADIFIKAIDKISITNAKEILNGKNDAATEFFRKNTTNDLKALISPIIKESIEKNQVASYYQTFNSFYQSNVKSYVNNTSIMSYAKSFGVDTFIPGNEDINLNEYITNKAIDGLFIMIKEEEKAIRENPVQRTSSILKKVFGN